MFATIARSPLSGLRNGSPVLSRTRACGRTQGKIASTPPHIFSACIRCFHSFCVAGRASGGILLFASRAPHLRLGEILLGLLEHVPNDAARTPKSALDEARKASCSREWRLREGRGVSSMTPHVEAYGSSDSGRNYSESPLIVSELSRQPFLLTISTMPLSIPSCGWS